MSDTSSDYINKNKVEDAAESSGGRRKATPGEEERGAYTYEYPRPALTADNVIFGFDGDNLKVLLIRRGVEPYKGYWALPGGFMRMSESIEECARRELFEETNVKDVYLEQFHTFSDPKRDPRGRVVSVAFIALVRPSDHKLIGGDDATDARWFSTTALPSLAFDHEHILELARECLKQELKLRPVAFRLLNEVFTIDEIRKVYEAINELIYDRRNFERKLLNSGVVDERNDMPTTGKRALRRYSLSEAARTMIDDENSVLLPDQSDDEDCVPEASYNQSAVDEEADLATDRDSMIPEMCCCASLFVEYNDDIGAFPEEKATTKETVISDEAVASIPTKNTKSSKDFGSLKNLFNFFDF